MQLFYKLLIIKCSRLTGVKQAKLSDLSHFYTQTIQIH